MHRAFLFGTAIAVSFATASSDAQAATTYDKEATHAVLSRSARQVKKNCGYARDADGRANGPWGRTQVTIVLSHTGRTRSVTVPAPFADKPSGRCVVQAFSHLAFPPWDGTDMTLVWDVEVDRPKS